MWNLSSIGGTIMRTFLRSSFVVADMLGESGIILVQCSWIQVFRDAKMVVDKYILSHLNRQSCLDVIHSCFSPDVGHHISFSIL